MLLYDRFYRRYGVRRIKQLTQPRRVPLELIELPRASVLHYLPQSQTDSGPSNDEYLFRGVSKPIMMLNITELTAKEGNPILRPEPIAEAIRDYHLANRRFRKLKDTAILKSDELTQLCVNYCWIPKRYRYIRNQYSTYNAWSNLQNTFWKQVNQTATETQRQQFIQINVPTTLPTLSELNRFSDTFGQQLIRTFNTPDLLMFLELWRWLANSRSRSVLNHVSPGNYRHINLVLRDKQIWTVVNLGMINSARKATKEELLVDPSAPKNGLDPLMVAKLLLVGMHDLVKRRSLTSEETARQFADSEEDDSAIDHEDLVDETTKKPTKVYNPFDVKIDEDTTVINLTGDDSVTDDVLAELSKQVDDELSTIDERKVRNDKRRRVEKTNQDELEDAEDLLLTSDGEEVQDAEGEDEPEPIVYDETPEGLFEKALDNAASQGGISTAEQTRHIRLSKSYQSIEMPNGQTLEEFIAIPPESLVIEEPKPEVIHGLPDQAMAGSTLNEFDSKYIEEVMDRDIAAAILGVQAAGYAVTGFTQREVQSVEGDYVEYFVKIIPIEGAPVTLRFVIPKVDEDGTFMVGGIRYHSRKQQGVHLPIAKVDESKVALTSYYAKNFVTRPTIKAADYGYWLCNAIKLLNLDGVVVKDAAMIRSFDPKFKAPRLVTYLAKEFTDFKVIYENVEYHFYVTPNDRDAFFGQEAIERFEHQGARLIAKYAGGLLYVDKDGILFNFNGQAATQATSLEVMIGLNAKKAPIEYSELSIMGRLVPIGFIIAREVGLSALIKETKAFVRRVPAGSRVSLIDGEYAIQFLDETLVFKRSDNYAALLFGGFSKFRKSVMNYNVHEFDSPHVYLNVLEEVGMGSRIMNEIDLRYQMFVDPITREILVDMKEPTTYGGLLRRATELLLTDYVPDTQSRVRGYERVAGAIYSELVSAIREHKNRYGRERAQLDLGPYDIQSAILNDPSTMIVGEINPIEDLKQSEAMSYSGTGGRDAGTMNKSSRAYRPNEQGLVSEATVDSGNVAVNTFTSANPKFNSVRGTYTEYNLEEDDPSRLVSTSMMLSPGADHDDSKRAVFISIQHGHGISCEGYKAASVRTGYEQVIATRVSKTFAYTAKEDGEVVSVKPDGIIVEYVSGKRVGVELGRHFGSISSLTFPFNIVTPLSQGQRFLKGHAIAYNEQFFEKDYLNYGGLVYKGNLPVRVALMENPATYEDSSSISVRLSERLATKLSHVVKVVIRVDQSIHNIVKVGQEVSSRDELCILEDSITADSGLFDAETLATLSSLGAQTPRAGTHGIVEKIEIRYNAEHEQMSDTVKALVLAQDEALAKSRKAVNKPAITNRVSDSYRVNGAPLLNGLLELRVYITERVGTGVGDKLVFGNQLKTIIGEVTPEPLVTESGDLVDARFGSIAVGARIVRSPYIIGTTAVLMRLLTTRALNAYKGKT